MQVLHSPGFLSPEGEGNQPDRLTGLDRFETEWGTDVKKFNVRNRLVDQTAT